MPVYRVHLYISVYFQTAYVQLENDDEPLNHIESMCNFTGTPDLCTGKSMVSCLDPNKSVESDLRS